MKNILCKVGLHKPNKFTYLQVCRKVGRHKWHRNYVVCERCGKRLSTFAVKKRKEGAEG